MQGDYFLDKIRKALMQNDYSEYFLDKLRKVLIQDINKQLERDILGANTETPRGIMNYNFDPIREQCNWLISTGFAGIGKDAKN